MESFPSESNCKFLFESNQMANRECSNQIFAWSNQIPGAVESRFKSNRDLDLPITANRARRRVSASLRAINSSCIDNQTHDLC